MKYSSRSEVRDKNQLEKI